MIVYFLLLTAYLLGAMPWSVWLSQWFAQRDPREFADGNPGAANTFRAAGKRIGAAVLILDFAKAFVPVALAKWVFDIADWGLFWIAIAPTLGHAFSVFLNFRGGRALAVMFGVWAGLTLYEIPMLVGGVAILSLFVVKNDDLRSLLIPFSAIAYLSITGSAAWMLGVAMLQLGVLGGKIAYHHISQNVQEESSLLDAA
jgi:glycerol-3-phosphate acyltransferase PlsY